MLACICGVLLWSLPIPGIADTSEDKVVAPSSPAPLAWQAVAQGLELVEIQANFDASNGPVAILRINPTAYTLELHTISEPGGALYTPGEWAERHNLVALINASMFLPDGATSTGYMRNSLAVNNSRINQRFGSFLVFDPVTAPIPEPSPQTAPTATMPGDPFAPHALPSAVDNSTPLPAVDILDRYTDAWETLLPRYHGVVQNFRMISPDRTPLWPEEGRLFSIAAIGKDSAGNILFIHCTPQATVRALSEFLLDRLPTLGSTMYVEGGVQAVLQLRLPDTTITWQGRKGSNFWYATAKQWPLPNVIGIRKRTAK